MKHVMLDLETFGVRPGFALRSLGAVEFELDGTTGRTCYANISRASCDALGLKIDPNTERWWSEQSAEARAALEVDPKPIRDVVESFNAWFAKVGGVYLWCHGAAFDAVLYEAACVALRVPLPWKFYNVRDTRTVLDLFDFDLRELHRDGTHHDALDDARFQVRAITEALKKGRKAAAMNDGVFG